jgi:hypothetical protein
MGIRVGLRPKIPELVFDTTFLSWRPADPRLFGWQAGGGGAFEIVLFAAPGQK